jgi:hypothetical protein
VVHPRLFVIAFITLGFLIDRRHWTLVLLVGVALTTVAVAGILSVQTMVRKQARSVGYTHRSEREPMSAKIISNSDGILTAKISGKLTQPELAALQASTVDSIRQQGQVRILIIAEDFQGWRESDDWSDVSFLENDPYIKKMAIVAEQQWKELALVFSASPIRKFPVQFFQPADLAQAQAWLTAD